MSNNGKPTALQTDMDKTASAFESFLTPEEDKVEETVEEQEVVEEEYSEDDEEILDDIDDEIAAELDEYEESDEEQTNVEEEIEQPLTFTVKVDGQDIEVTQEELINGYSRQQDYTRKTQELSQQRKTIEQQQAELAQRDAIYSQLLPKMEAQLKGELANEPDWSKLYEDDPVGYVREKQLWDEKKEKAQAIQAEQQRLQEEAFAEQQKQIQQQVEFGQQRLLELIPEWQNPEVAAKEKAAIRDYAINTLEYTQQEVDSVYDYRALLGLRKAWLNDKIAETVKKKPTQKAPARVARPGTVNKKKSITPVRRAKQRLAKTGKTSDAAKVFEQLI
jgi:DNA repair exonuclease SbcCD ATPase subunit